MLEIIKVNTESKEHVHRFIRLPFRLYKNNPHWVPLLSVDAKAYLNRKKHPFYEHSDVEFFLAVRDGIDVGRIAAIENKRFNEYHGTREAQFYFFDCEDDQEAANALFERIFEWAKKRNLNRLIGPKGMGPLDGYGILVEGFEHRQAMTMMYYNYPYYPKLVENLGFQKEVDFISCYVHTSSFQMPERIRRIAERVEKRGTLQVQRFKSKRELLSWADRIGKAYNEAFINNWEYYPLTEREIKYVVDNIMMVANPQLIKIITHDQDVVGFVLGFPDVSAALQRANGNLSPLAILDLLIELKRTKRVILNGAGILPEFQGRGGNALLYNEMEKTVRDFGFIDAELTQIAETAVQMRKDLENVGAKPYKNHRVYYRWI